MLSTKTGSSSIAQLRGWTILGVLAGTLLSGSHAFAQSPQHTPTQFVNVADSTQGLSQFSQFPAINQHGEVALIATPATRGAEVFKWEHGELKPIASTEHSQFTFFTDDVVISDAGVVAFRATLNTGGRATGIFTSNGFSTRTIVNSTAQALPGPGIGSASINASGTVAFQAFRNGFRSSVIFTGNGGPLTPVLDTLNTGFGTFGVVAINDSGAIVFRAVLKDRNEGVFVLRPDRGDRERTTADFPAASGVTDVLDSTNPGFFQFGDPVINQAGVVADFAGGPEGEEIVTAKGGSITPRTDPASGFFTDFEHPSINNQGAVAFSAFEASGAQGIFLEVSGGALPEAVLQSGDLLFGSTVTALSVGRFALNDHLQLAFEYELADGRSGIAVASLAGP